jgi:two-component system sensor histidine kinase/response regulator
LDAYAHTVAHDLKSPLGTLIGYATLLQDTWNTVPPEEIRVALQHILRTGHKMCAIIDELLLIASTRQQEVETNPLNTGDIVADVQQRLAYMIEKCRAEIIVPADWPTVLGHAPWVEEVWVNYISNAIGYGGQPPRVELGATAQADGLVRFWVRDNGRGLTPEEQAQLFTPFTQLSQARARGHGLGLSIVQRIVEKLGGQVGVESAVGQGSVFYFTLPGAGKRGPEA